jgi:hypothetical protein
VGQNCQRAGAAGLGCWAAQHGRARECECGRERADGPRGWAEPERGGVGPRWILFFFFKNVNSNSICLFH